jgi:UDP-N-acetylglucosamine transferase subunit ALG13
MKAPRGKVKKPLKTSELIEALSQHGDCDVIKDVGRGKTEPVVGLAVVPTKRRPLQL